MTRLTAEAYTAVQRMRAAFIEAGEEGWCGREHDRRGFGFTSDQSRLCVFQRHAWANGEMALITQIHINEVAAQMNGDWRRDLIQTNDYGGYAATVALLDRLLTECAPDWVPSASQGSQFEVVA